MAHVWRSIESSPLAPPLLLRSSMRSRPSGCDLSFGRWKDVGAAGSESSKSSAALKGLFFDEDCDEEGFNPAAAPKP